jgi:hypothetical protein
VGQAAKKPLPERMWKRKTPAIAHGDGVLKALEEATEAQLRDHNEWRKKRGLEPIQGPVTPAGLTSALAVADPKPGASGVRKRIPFEKAMDSGKYGKRVTSTSKGAEPTTTQPGPKPVEGERPVSTGATGASAISPQPADDARDLWDLVMPVGAPSPIWRMYNVTLDQVRQAVNQERLLPFPGRVAPLPIWTMAWMELPRVEVELPEGEGPAEFLERQGVPPSSGNYPAMLGLLYQRQVCLMPTGMGKQTAKPGAEHGRDVIALFEQATADLRIACGPEVPTVVLVDLIPLRR